MSKKPEHGKKSPAWKVVKGVGLEILQGKKKEHQHSGEVDGKTKYTLLCCLLVRLGSQVLRDVFDRTIQPKDLCSSLRNEPAHSKLQSLRKEGILNPMQWSQLYPIKPSSVSSTGFDPSLLIVLLRTICNLSPPSSGWDLLPHSLDTSCESDIARLKYFVDAVSASAKEASVSDAVFCNYKDQIQNTLVRLGGAEYEDAIHELEKHEMGPLDEEHFKELLKRWKDGDERIKDKLNEWECTMKTSRDAVSGAVDGRSKYTLLCCLLVRLGSQVLRDVFDRAIPPPDLCNSLQHEPVLSQLQCLRKEGILNPVQWSQLYPVKPSSVSSTGFDPSLLIVLLRTICNLSPPSSGWDVLPHSLDASCESDIVRLKYCVNALSAHAGEASVTDATFCKYREQIQNTLVRLGGAEYEDAISEIEKQEMDPWDEEHFKELLKQWKDGDDRIKDKLNEWECIMKTSGEADRVQPEASCADVVSAAATGSSTHTHHEQGAVDGKTKYTLLCCLLVKLGSQVLRDVFDRTIHPQDLCSVLKNEPAHSKLQSLRKEGILNPVQWSQWYSANSSSVSSTGFDPSLLIVLLRTICNLSPPSSGWDVLPHSLDASCESDIVRLKYCVNALSAHAGEASVSDATFCKYREQIQNTLIRLGGAEYEDAIREIEKQEMDPWDEEHFKELLKQWKDGDDRIKDKLNEWECIMKTSGEADRVQPEASCADVVSAAATGSSTHTHHEQDALDGKTKYTLLCCLLVRLGSQVLRDVFDRIMPPENLSSDLKREPVHSKLQSLRKEGILSSGQWSKLYSVKPSSVSSTGFDPSLLIVLLRTICNLNSPSSGWDLPPHSLDTSFQSDIVRLKYCVNALSAHAEEASVSDSTFCKYREQIQNTLVRLGGAEYEDAIREIEKQEMDPWDEEHFKELLKQWKDGDDRIKDKLNEWESIIMETSGDADPVHPEASCADVLSAAAGTSTRSQYDQDLPYSANIIERIRQLYSTREKFVLPVPWCEDFSFHLDDIFTKLKIVGKEKTRGTWTDEITNMTAIFKGHEDCAEPRTVLIEGDPGMGKTTYCQKLAYDWAMKRKDWDESFPEIDVLLLLRCRDMETNIWEAIDDQILPVDIEEDAKKWFFKFIRENQSKVLLVLDGLDEVDSSNFDLYNDLLESRVLPNCRIVITSRHEAGRTVRRYCDTLWEIIGFTFADAQIYIRKYFKGMEHLAEELVKQLLSDRSELRQLTRNPLNTALLCIIWEDFKGVLPPEKTQLYIEIVRCVLLRYEKKIGSSNGSNVDLLEVYKDDLVQLGCMALQSLRKGELYFDEKKLKGSSSNLIKFGFLSIQTGGSKRKRSLRFGFLHKSFQEFFAGFYLAYEILDGDRDCNSVVTDVTNRNELKQVFLFMSGILSATSEEMTVSLVKSIAEHASSSTDLHLALSCILECKCHGENLQSKLLQILGQNFLVKDLDIYIGATLLNLFCEFLKVNTCVTTLKLHFIKIGVAVTELLSEALKVNTCLTTLDMSWNKVGDAGAEPLSEALKVNTCLTTLDLSNNEVGDAGAESLSEALKVNTSLTTLNLKFNEVGAAGAESLSEALKVNTCLTTLDLSNNKVGDAGAESLSEALKVNTCLTTLNFKFNKVGAAGAESLSEALKVNTCLTTLDLSNNEVGDACAESLSEALKVNTCLTTLNLKFNEVGGAGAESLSEALKVNTCLTTLDLSNNEVGAAGAISLSEALKVNTCLTTLDLSNDKVGDAGAESLSEALKVNTCLTTLDLSSNEVSDAGAESLSEALKVNTFLTTLNLKFNKVGAAGAEALSEALKVNTCLTTLDLSNNKVRAAGAKSLSEALKVNTCLTTLNLKFNKVGDAGAESLSEALKVNTCLTTLKLKFNEVGAAGAESLSQALKVNRCLTTLNLKFNKVGAAGAESLSEALKVNTCLTTLDLSNNEVGDAGAESLSEALKVNTCLITLNLKFNKVAAAGAESLSEALKVNTCLTTLDLIKNEIGDAGAESLSEALKVNTCLTTLDLSCNEVGAAGAESLSEALKVNTCLTTLNLSCNEVGAAGAESLSEALKVNTCLITLDLSNNEVGDAGAESLSEALKVNTCLTTLDLSNNKVGDAGAESLSKALKVNTCLTTLNLKFNKVGAVGPESLSEALKVNTCLTTLDLSNNEVGAAGAESLSEALKVNTCLISLNLKFNKVGVAGAESLSEALKVNKFLTTLDLSNNEVGDAGAESLSEALKVNTCLTTLDLSKNEVCDAGAESLSEALKVNTCLTTLDLSWNEVGDAGAESLSEALKVNTCLITFYFIPQIVRAL
ncbi:protein NLRC5-like isoform X2 [Montipora foliosa]|uniref:protein NLRC5-like isoform X2 n=1 Tax=Montipora foliosa TaxID=591990 RepID=UPI0035F19172